MNKIRIGIVGYGNLGRGVEKAIKQNSDMELVKIFTRRDPKSLGEGFDLVSNANLYKNDIDVMVMCGGSATDLPVQVPSMAELFNTVDSFDTHAKIPEYFEKVNKSAKENNNLSIISAGWDPGLFSLNRVLMDSVLPEGKTYTFWGKGVSQGHSDAIRRIDGVLDAKQYTIPVDKALLSVRNGEMKDFSTREKHTRLCFVVAEDGADKERIEQEIKNMPNYFSDYDTTVNFITLEELKRDHSGLPHGGFVIRSGLTGEETKQKMEFQLELGSNPEFTSSVLVCCARAVYKMREKGQTGAISMLDIPVSMFSPLSDEELRAKYL
ncbi:MAG: diaminopimelate dehydrogenase [Clostridia bacterium]|nr:diaminopimelate dehydrogenase [Clostridia bacterium]